MFKAYKVRLYPNKEQKVLIQKTFGCYRFVYNYFLSKCRENGFIKAFDMCKELKEMYISYPWLKEVDSCSLRCAIFNLEDAYKNFFAKRSNQPVFKSKYRRQTYRTNCIRSIYKEKEYANISLDLKNKTLTLPKLGKIVIRGYRNLAVINGKIINVTVIKEQTGKYYASIIVDEIAVKREKVTPKTIIGIDLGVKDLVITSDGEKFDNNKVLKKNEKRLKRLQRKLSRQVVGSKNSQKTKRKLAVVHSKIKNTRVHYIISIVNKLVRENDIIISEKLNVKGLSQNHKLAQSILDASFSRICNQLKWKAEEKGKYYYQVDTYYPSSKICNRCGSISEITKDLSIRNWECGVCGESHDRDINASINIMFEGLRLHYEG